MSEDLTTNLNTYKLQLQQVEVALTTDPKNEDLQKLRKDLQEVLNLTEDLIVSQSAAEEATAQSSAAPSSEEKTKKPQGASTSQDAAIQWKVGDRCVAVWSVDQQMYDATIDEILEDGTCTVTFDRYGNTSVTQVSSLKLIEQGKKRGLEDGEGTSKRPKTKRDIIAAEREYKKKKQQKKAQRMKQLEEERETEKNKWLDFNAKAFAKSSKGKVKKSIFASPDTVGGRVGVGTCGVSGRKMTPYSQQEKWKK